MIQYAQNIIENFEIFLGVKGINNTREIIFVRIGKFLARAMVL